MSMSYSLVLLMHRVGLGKKLNQLEPYILPARQPPPHAPELDFYYVENLVQRRTDFLNRVDGLLKRVNEPIRDDIHTDDLARVVLERGGKERLAIFTTPWMQNIFKLTMQPPYMLVNLEYNNANHTDFIPMDFPLLDFIFEVLAALKPVYAWTVGDFDGTPSEYWWQGEEYPSSQMPWHERALTQVFNKQLRDIAEKKWGKTFEESGLQIVLPLGDGLTWVTMPRDANPGRFPYYDPDSEVSKTHLKAWEELVEVLKSIPASALKS